MEKEGTAELGTAAEREGEVQKGALFVIVRDGARR